MDYPTDNIFDLIERYLNNELNEGERIDFEKQLSENEQLRLEVEKHQIANVAIIESDLSAIREKLKTHHKPTPTKNNTLRNIGLGVVGMSLLGGVLILNSQQETQTTQKPVLKDAVVTTPTIQDTTTVLSIDSIVSPQVQQIESTPKNKPFIKTEDSTIDSAHTIEQPKTKPDSSSSVSTNNKSNDTKEKHTPEPKTDPCLTTSINVSVKTTPACDDFSKMGTLIPTVSGGLKPYLFMLNNELIQLHEMNDLSEGVHELYIIDKNKCQSEVKEVEITSIDCSLNEPFVDAFSPSKGQTWKAPVNNDIDANLIIYNQAQVIVKEEQIYSGDAFEWEGTNLNNNTLPSGTYIIKIQYDDGTIRIGTVEIL